MLTNDFCLLYCVERTDLLTWERRPLTYALTDFTTAVNRAAHYQKTFDPKCERYDYRVSMVD